MTITDVRAGRLDAAARLGLNRIDVTENRTTDIGLTPTVLLECSGDASATYDAVRFMAAAGRVVLIGIGGGDLSLPMAAVRGRELTLSGVFRHAGTWPATIDLAVRGAVDLYGLVTGHYAVDEVEAALSAPARDPSTVNPIVLPAHRRNQPRRATRR